MNKIAVSIVTSFMVLQSYAQITIQNTQSPQQLIDNVLLGGGITATNVTYNGAVVNAPQHNVTNFDGTGTTFPIQQGLLLTTGSYQTAIGPNDDQDPDMGGPYPELTDPDLDMLLNDPNFTPTNGAILEFDFQALSDTFSFSYIFASDEYPEYVGQFNDIFGFIISGPGISGPFSNNGLNLAVIPTTASSTNVVSINNVSDQTNSQYYVDNLNGAAYGNAIEYDGTTVLLSSGAKLQCNQTYHIKMCVANVLDQALGTAVFIKAKSFAAQDITFGMPNNFNNFTIEDCPGGNNNIIIARPENQVNTTMTIDLTYAGTATSGTDYQALPTTVTFPIGEDTLTFPISVIDDNVTEGMEYILISASYQNICGNTISFTDTLKIIDPIPVVIDTEIDTFFCTTFYSTVDVTSGISPYTYLWSNGATTETMTIADITNINSGMNTFTVTVTDACGNTAAADAQIVYLPIDAEISASAMTAAPPPATINFYNNSQYGTSYEWDFGNGTGITVNDLSSQSVTYLDSGYYQVVLTVTSNYENKVCTDYDTLIISILNKPVVINVPNVFSPNGDEDNDEYFITTKSVEKMELIIFNRWGEIMFDKTAPEPRWNGKDTKGNKASDGVYFYHYKATGFSGDVLEGHGFLHLVE